MSLWKGRHIYCLDDMIVFLTTNQIAEFSIQLMPHIAIKCRDSILSHFDRQITEIV